jgi:hypothetical protein
MGNYGNKEKQRLDEYVQISDTNAVEEVNEHGIKEKHWYLQGIFMQGEIENLNGRIYPRSEIEYAVSQLNEKIELFKQKKGPALMGELDHPDKLTVNLDRVSHTIDEIHMEGNNGVGKMKILSKVPCGKIVEGFLEEGIPLGVSTRGSGEVDDYTNMVSDFDIVTIDIVATPSAMDARPTAIYEQLTKNSKGQKLLNNAQDYIVTNNPRFQNSLNEDIVSWFRSWNYK